MLFRHLLAVAVAQDRFQHDADGDGQARDVADARFLKRGQRIQRGLFATGKVESLARVEQVVRHGVWLRNPNEKKRDYSAACGVLAGRLNMRAPVKASVVSFRAY